MLGPTYKEIQVSIGNLYKTTVPLIVSWRKC